MVLGAGAIWFMGQIYGRGAGVRTACSKPENVRFKRVETLPQRFLASLKASLVHHRKIDSMLDPEASSA